MSEAPAPVTAPDVARMATPPIMPARPPVKNVAAANKPMPIPPVYAMLLKMSKLKKLTDQQLHQLQHQSMQLKQ